MSATKFVIALSAALAVIASTLILPLLAPLVREIGLSSTQGGVMLSTGSIAMVLAAPFWGRISERFGRRAVIVAGFLGILLGYLLFAFAADAGLSGRIAGTAGFAALTAARVVMGLFLLAVPVGAQALMADATPPDKRAAGMALIGAATGIGMIVGPVLSGLLVGFSLTLPLFAAAILCALGALVGWFALGGHVHVRATRKQKSSQSRRHLRPWLTAGVILWTMVATIQICGGFWFKDRLGLTAPAAAQLISAALAIVGVAMFAAQILQLRLFGFAPRLLVISGATMMIVGNLTLLATNDAGWFLLAYAFMGLGAGWLMPGIMGGASLAVDADAQGTAAGLVAATQGIGFIIGPMLSTALYDLEPGLPFQVMSAVLAVCALFFALRRPGATAPRPESVFRQ